MRVRSAFRWLLPAIVVLAWLGAAGPLASFGGKLTAVQQNDSAAFLPDSAESTRVTALDRRFLTTDALPVILLWEGNGALGDVARAEIGRRVTAAVTGLEARNVLAGPASPAIPSADGRAVQAVLPLRTDLRDQLPGLVADLRALPPVAGATAYVTGPAALFADFANGFSGIDGLLLLAAFGVVLLILLVIYRSPLLPLLVIGTAGLALTASTAVAYALAKPGWIAVDGQSQGIAAILVVGAATDYGLLLVARFREELSRERSRLAAMRTALRRSRGPILASGATVILGVLGLLLSDLASNRGLGPISAVSVLLALLAALTFLPATLVLLGRAAFWPFQPRVGDSSARASGWQRAALVVDRRPGRVLGWSVAGLLVLAALAPTFDARGTSLTDAVRGGSPAATGQVALARHFDVGAATPAVVITPARDWTTVAGAAAAVPGVVRVAPDTGAPTSAPAQPGGEPKVVNGLVRLEAVLGQAPDSDAALDTVAQLRAAVHRADPRALVGGATASTLDARNTGARDLRVIVPAVLLVVGVVLALLLRALVAPLLLV
ncbi:MAG: MMPL family transporter, partial [Actinomycetota bacterium]